MDLADALWHHQNEPCGRAPHLDSGLLQKLRLDPFQGHQAPFHVVTTNGVPMFGAPPDKPDECNARLFLGDDYGDGTCTIRCKLPPGHEGPHKEKTNRCLITWEKDERCNCPKHGMQPEDWCHACHEEDRKRGQETCEHGIKREDCDACWEKEYGTKHDDSGAAPEG